MWKRIIIFYFIYRKRIWNAKEDSYLGYERKRGALLHFNKILLKDTDKAFENKFVINNSAKSSLQASLNSAIKKLKSVIS